MDHIQDLEPRCSKHWQRPGAPHWGNGLPGGLLLLALTTLPLHPGARGPGQHGSEVHSARRADDRRGDTGPAMPQGRGHTDSHSQSSPTLSDLPDPGLAPRPADSPSGQAGGPQEVSAPSSSSGNSHGEWPFLRPPECVPEVPVLSREHLPHLEKIQEVPPPGEMRPISVEASRG